MRALRLLAPLLLLAASAAAQGAPSELAPGRWHAWLESPGGELPFALDLERDAAGALGATIWNGAEAIEVTEVAWTDGELLLGFPHYDSRIRARLDDSGRLSGEWEKRRGAERFGRLPFHAAPGASARFPELAAAETTDVAGRWAVDFERDALPAVAVLEQDGSSVTGTVLTATGDYRFLAGAAAGGELALSVFDGAHAFLLTATVQPDGTLQGDFWSLDSWHETWTARRDDEASLPDPFAQTRWDESASLADLVLQDLDGALVSLAELAASGRGLILQLFGSWCPNCNDEARFLVELDERYRDRGLVVLGLAFELTGDFARDAEQVRKFAARHGVEYPLFLVGPADKDLASEAFPAIDHLRSYPTTIFMTADGRVHDVHSGFSGPATGPAYDVLRADYVERIEALLAEEPDDGSEAWEILTAAESWGMRGENRNQTLSFVESEEGERIAIRDDRTIVGKRVRRKRLPAVVVGDAVWVGERQYRLDRRAAVLVDARRFEERYYRDGDISPVVTEPFGRNSYSFERATESDDPVVRREGILAEGYRRWSSGEDMFEYIHLAEDPSFQVRLALLTAVSMTKDRVYREIMLEHLEHPNPQMRRIAILAMMRGALREPDLRERLKPLRQDPHPLVQEAAKSVLSGR